MKSGHFFVITILIFNLLTFGILPSSECSHNLTTVSGENLGLSESLQVSREYLPTLLSPALFASKSKPQIQSWHDRLLLEFPLRTHQPFGHFLSEVFLLPPIILELVSATVLRCWAALPWESITNSIVQRLKRDSYVPLKNSPLSESELMERNPYEHGISGLTAKARLHRAL